MLGAEGNEFSQLAAEDLTALGKVAYRADKNQFTPMLIDGYDMSKFRLPRTGYTGSEGTTWRPSPATAKFLWAYVLGYDVTKQPFLWEMARHIAAGRNLGDLGEPGGKGAKMNPEAPSADPDVIFAMLELYDSTKNPEYLDFARRVGDNILRDKFHKNFFLPGKDYVYGQWDSDEALALLHLAAAMMGKESLVPQSWGGTHQFACEVHPETDTHYTYDRTIIYPLRKTASGEIRLGGKGRRVEKDDD
jgi:hypothetical protein